jgi:DNA-binding transcriptional MerR regulator
VETGTSVATYAVGEVARLAGVTVRTLHHYDEIGLLRPGARTAAGHRVYGDPDLARLQRILGYRELGFGLDEVARLLDDPAVDPLDHLRRQRDLLRGRADRLHVVIGALEKTMEAHAMGIRLTPQEIFEVFGEHDPTEHAPEAEERWGDTDAYRESARRTTSYTKEDWLTIKGEEAATARWMVALLQDGTAPDNDAAMDAAEAHRQHISRWFYECSPAMHRGLAQMYVADPRFTATYEAQAAGLAQWVHDAIEANAARHEQQD